MEESSYLAISFSHKNTDISYREKISFDDNESIVAFLSDLKKNHEEIKEILLLSTCNRIEIYAYVNNPENSKNIILDLLSKYKRMDFNQINNLADFYINQGAIHHIFCVASSLDSLVVGETQIAGQLKSAYKFCFDNSFCGKNMTRLIHFAFRCAAEVRNSTQISQSPISIASVATKEGIRLLEQNNIDNKIAIVIGVGEMGILTSKHLLSCGYKILLLNRNKQKALSLSKELDDEYPDKIEVRNFSELSNLINQYHLLFSATSAPYNIITKAMVEMTDFKRFWFDLAMPRDIEKLDINNIKLFVVDDLKEVVTQNIYNRQKNTAKAYEIVGIYTIEFFKWLQSLSVEPLIKKLREFAKEASLKELNKAIKKGYIPEQYYNNVEKILHGAFNVFLHKPTINIKNLSEKEEADPVIEAIKAVFDINEEVMLINRYKCEYDTTTH